MSPTIKPGEVLEVDFNAYAARDPERWDVVLFRSLEKTNALVPFRVIGLPGETVDVRTNGVFINGQPMPVPETIKKVRYLPPSRAQKNYAKISLPYAVPTNGYFVVGDNTAEALDSRFWGAVPRENIVGKALPKK
jgi:signal peptidase I